MNDPESLFTALVNRGYQPHVAAGILGNMAQESGFDTSAIGDNGNARGLMQWNGPRKAALERYAKSKRRNLDDPETQLDFMDSEMRSTGLYDAIHKARSAREAAQMISDKYERPNPQYANNARRKSAAEQFLSMFNPIGTAEAAEDPGDWEDVQQETSAADPGDWEDVSQEASPEQPQPQQFGDLTTGIRRGIEKKWVGAQQIGSDIARFIGGDIGKEKSPYREELDRRGRQLQSETEAAPMGERIGEHIPSAVAMAALPVPKAGFANILPRMGYNAATGGALAALDPAESGSERGLNVGRAALLSAAMPEVMGGAANVIGAARGIAGGKYGAARELNRELATTFGGRTQNVDLVAPSRLSDALPGGMGPPTPRYAYVEGVQPTAAMLSADERLAQLEQNARTRNTGGQFRGRDISNTEAVYKALENRALPDSVANDLQMMVNDTTGPIRKTAMSLANLTGSHGDSAAQMIAGLKPIGDEGRIAKMAAPFLEDGTPEGLYMLRKELDDKLRMKGPALDEATNAVKNSRRLVAQLKGKIDEGLNDSSFGLWDVYLKSHAKGMEPITEGRAFQDIIESMRLKSPLQGSDIPEVTPYALRATVDKNTTMDLGKSGTKDLLSKQGRMTVSDAIDVMNSIERARRGTQATSGSNTADKLASLMASGLVHGGGKVGAAINLVDALGRSAGASALDRALLNPESGELAEILRIYQKTGKPLPGPLARALRAVQIDAANAIGH